MEIFIIIIIIAVLIGKAQKKAIVQAKEVEIDHDNQFPRSPQTMTSPARRETMPNQTGRQSVPNQPRPTVVPNPSSAGKTAAQLKEEIWARLSEESKAKMLNHDTYRQMTLSDLPKNFADEDMSASEQIRKRRTEERNTSILDRAKGNNAENAKDVTLTTMEAEHNHSERVAPAIHHHPEDNLEESMLGKVEDLIATGYDGNLCFERDFLGEAMDMIGRFTVPSEIPEYCGDK